MHAARPRCDGGRSRHAGKLADIIMIDGDPLADIANTVKVRKVMANGRMHDVEQLIAPKR